MRDRQHSFAEFMARATHFAGLTILIGIMGLSGAQVDAQSTTVIGGHGSPSVEVDLSVLDSLPQPPTLPQLLYPGLASQGARFVKRLPLSVKPTRYNRRPMPARHSTRLLTSLAPTAAPNTPPGRQRNVTGIIGDPKPVSNTATATRTAPLSKTLPLPQTKSKPEQPATVLAKRTSAAVTPNPTTTTQQSGLTLRILFEEGASILPNSMATKLDGLVRELKSNTSSRLQLVAYATAADGSASKARRLSLSRALSVRAYLIDQGVKSTRMDVRALGSRPGSNPADRVDVVMTR